MSHNRENRTPDQTMRELVARVAELEAEALNWRGNFVLLANTINPEEDKPALDAAKELVARVAKLEYIIACNVDPSNCTDEDAEICRECHKTAFPENYRL